MTRTAAIHLGGQDYTVSRLPASRIFAWRRQAEKLLSSLPALQALYQKEASDVVSASLHLYAEANDVAEQVVEVVLAADPALSRQRDKILDAAQEDEFLAALMTLLLLNAPLTGLAMEVATPPALNGATEPLTA